MVQFDPIISAIYLLFSIVRHTEHSQPGFCQFNSLGKYDESINNKKQIKTNYDSPQAQTQISDGGS